MMIFTLIAAQSPDLQKNKAPSIIEKSSKSGSATATETKGSNPLIQESLNNGRYIRLSDNSLWEINPKDTPITQSWITPAEIIAAPSGDATYPYRLTNSLTGSSVLARRTTAIPKTPPQTIPATKK